MQLAEVQMRLAGAGFYDGAVDGRYGPHTAAAIEALFLARPVTQGNWRRWSAKRRIIAAAQFFCLLDGIEVGAVDGLMGPQTRHAFEVYDARLRGIEGLENWRDVESAAPDPRRGADAPASSAARRNIHWPLQAQKEMEKFFGLVGTNQALLDVPDGYPLRLAWNLRKPVRRFSCHEKIHDAVRRVLARVLDHYGPERIRELGLDRFGGCLNVRRMRGGRAWSTHAWGAALDFDPEHNQLRWDKRRARFAQPDYAAWWRAWEGEGFVSLGRARDFDWMHVQAAKL